MIEIEKDISMASYERSKHPEVYQALEKMDVKDSFFVEDEKISKANLSTLLFVFGKRIGKKFSRRSVEGGNRVWRVE